MNVNRNSNESTCQQEKLSINPNLSNLFVFIITAGDALGFFHEQARPDRDQYVEILTHNIKKGGYCRFYTYPVFVLGGGVGGGDCKRTIFSSSTYT